MFEVITFGSAILDVFLRVPEIRKIKSHEFSSGEALLLPHGTKCEVTDLVMGSGGGGTNTAVGFARLGLKTAVVARCGWDFAGKIIRNELKKEEVDDSLLVQKENETTDYSTIISAPDGDRTILVYRGGTCLEKTDINWSKLKAKWFYVSSLEGNLDLLREIVSFAQKQKIRIAVNPGKKEIEQKDELKALLKDVDVVILNKEEADVLSELSTNGIVVTTYGSGGVIVLDKEKKKLKSETFKVEMVDATGAGDAFGAGFVAGLVKWWKLEDALKLGAANGASQVTELGAKAGLLYEKNLHNWLDRSLKMTWSK